METTNKWPKRFPPLTSEQQTISDDFMRHWHETLARNLGIIDKFNHGYVAQRAPQNYLTTLEIGAGLGEHLRYEKLTPTQQKNYVALEIRENMAQIIQKTYPAVQTLVGDCQQRLPFDDNYFNRIIAIHILEHLPNLPAAIKEMYRLCNKNSGQLAVVIPCEGGWAYSLARKISAQRIFERRYQQSYHWFISREHINVPDEIMHELSFYFDIAEKSFYPLYLPVIDINICIGLILRPKQKVI
jgi:ubiquinone/menaquinone biosynthesis C-methylase UbiE